MDEAKAREWRLLSRAARERRILERIFRGDVLTPRLGEQFTRGPSGELPNRASEVLDDLRTRGLIVGYVPLLSPEGREYFAGLAGLEAALPPRDIVPTPLGTDPAICPDCGRPNADHDKKIVRCVVTTTIDSERRLKPE